MVAFVLLQQSRQRGDVGDRRSRKLSDCALVRSRPIFAWHECERWLARGRRKLTSSMLSTSKLVGQPDADVREGAGGQKNRASFSVNSPHCPATVQIDTPRKSQDDCKSLLQSASQFNADPRLIPASCYIGTEASIFCGDAARRARDCFSNNGDGKRSAPLTETFAAAE